MKHSVSITLLNYTMIFIPSFFASSFLKIVYEIQQNILMVLVTIESMLQKNLEYLKQFIIFIKVLNFIKSFIIFEKSEITDASINATLGQVIISKNVKYKCLLTFPL